MDLEVVNLFLTQLRRSVHSTRQFFEVPTQITNFSVSSHHICCYSCDKHFKSKITAELHSTFWGLEKEKFVIWNNWRFSWWLHQKNWWAEWASCLTNYQICTIVSIKQCFCFTNLEQFPNMNLCIPNMEDGVHRAGTS